MEMSESPLPRTRFYRGYTPEVTAYDVAIVGGGPAGLQCALVLARARRSTIVLDAGSPRNACAREAHGLFTRDGEAPADLLTYGRKQLSAYESATLREAAVQDVSGNASDGFILTTTDGEPLRARRIVLATGMRDHLPEIEGLEACWGSSVFVCPYCDGWEVRDRPIAVWGNTRSGIELARELYQWSTNIVVCSDLHTPIATQERTWMNERNVRIIESPIRRLRERSGILQAIEFDDGESVEREALFLSVRMAQASDLAERAGCRVTERGHIDVDADSRTSVAGIYAAGDSVAHLHQIVVAAASGARAAIAVNQDLTSRSGDV